MRLLCHACGARFKIADDRLRGKIVHIRCRSCGEVLEAHLPEPQHVPATESAMGSSVASGEETHPRRREPPPLPEREWYAALGARPVGPLGTEEVFARIRRGELHGEVLVWRRGLGDWQPLVAVDELRHALVEAQRPPPTDLPPPLPPSRDLSRDGARVLRLVPAGRQAGDRGARPAVALAEACPELLPEQAPRPMLAAVPQQPARWPLWVALLGGLMMVGSSGVLLVQRRGGQPEVALQAGARRAEATSPVSSLRIMPESEAPVAGQPTRLPALELRPGHQLAGASREALPDHRVEVPEAWERPADPSEQPATDPDDLKTTLALRIHRRNRATLTACDQLAERRGETFRRGSRAEFLVEVTASGRTSVEVRGRELSAELLACYRAVTSRWEVPVTGADYVVSFDHVH